MYHFKRNDLPLPVVIIFNATLISLSVTAKPLSFNFCFTVSVNSSWHFPPTTLAQEVCFVLK